MKILSIDQVKSAVQALLKNNRQVLEISRAIAVQGGRVLLVGGAVRDLLLGIAVKDLDIEVHNLSMPELEKILRHFGPVSAVGKAYGVLRLHGLDVDWSLPRADQAGRKPTVSIDPHMKIADAFARRDLTINAMGIDLITDELVDPFDGRSDLEHRILRAPDIRLFVEDPLRFFRVMQFISRFAMHPDAQLTEVCKSMDLSGVSRERIETEFDKMLLRSERPSLGLRWLHDIGRLSGILPELAATVGVVQGANWHPEGDVFEHLMQALDAAAALPVRTQNFKPTDSWLDLLVYDDTNQRLIGLYAALCHDLGKATTTRITTEKITSYGHAQAGVPLATRMLKRITNRKELIDTVCTLVNHHMHPLQLIKDKSKPPAFKRLAHALAPHVTIAMLVRLLVADRLGRNAAKGTPLTIAQAPLDDVGEFVAQCMRLRLDHGPETPVLQGRDLLDAVGSGPHLGALLKKAYRIQIEEGVIDKDELIKRVLKA